MSGLIESATAILSASERRLEVTAHNVANISTPGFKREVSFSRLLGSPEPQMLQPSPIRTARDFVQGKLSATGNPLDLAISGSGFFELRAGESLVYSRQGGFRIAGDGSVVNSQGYALQQAGGGDLVLQSGDAKILEDGTVLENGVPVARIAVFDTSDRDALQAVAEAHFAAPDSAMEIVPDAMVRQGMIENSNVELGEEMIGMMAALRQSESGARLVQIYDDLLGRTISAFGGGR